MVRLKKKKRFLVWFPEPIEWLSTTHPLITPVLWDPVPFSDPLEYQAHMVHIYTQKKNGHTHKFAKK